jgi:DNA processing protein
MQLDTMMCDFTERAVSPFAEFGAYEALWDEQGASFKSIAARFAANEDTLPSDIIPRSRAMDYANRAHEMLLDAGIKRYGVRVNGTLDYPDRLREADHPLEVFTYQGWWELVDAPRSVAVVGTRNPSSEGVARTRKLVKALVDDEVTIVSGLAQGVDTAAHTAAIDHGGRTIAVLGTPLSLAYPKANAKLQQEIAERHLLISQVPVVRYFNQSNLSNNNYFFPARNITMSALTDATVIVEAGETSGTLVQARHALKQGRTLFILESNFHKIGLEWPHKFEERGAIRVSDYADIRRHLFAEKATAH